MLLLPLLSFSLILLSTQLSTVDSFSYYAANIPNGNIVPNPCTSGTIWPGVGHQSDQGKNARNQFGLDFAANGDTWNATLCNKDSDGDGMSNGQELGDPSCVWKVGSMPARTTGLSHPGVCEPVTSPTCKSLNPWLSCAPFSCPAFNLTTTKTVALTFPRTSVPTQATTYICMGFRLPNITKYHVIGTTPVIGTPSIMHHMLLFGCDGAVSDSMLTTPQPCSMGIPGCQTLFGIWGVGLSGQCTSDQYGFPMGQGGFQYAVLQLHWNNPQNSAGLVDNSGMTLYYTDVLRPQNGQILMVGQMDLTLPPGQPSISYSGSCVKNCTQVMPQPLKVAGALLHMHLQGKAGSIELIRNGASNKLVTENNYDYNTPQITNFNNAIDFLPGDEVRVNCTYQTLNKNITTYWGEATSDEMCFGFITIYPALKGFDYCSTWKDLPMCPLSSAVSYPNCDVNTFNSFLSPIGQYCAGATNCSSRLCQSLASGVLSTRCLQGTLGDWIRKFYPQSNPQLSPVFNAISSCQASMPGVGTTAATTMTTGPGVVRAISGASMLGTTALGPLKMIMALLFTGYFLISREH